MRSEAQVAPLENMTPHPAAADQTAVEVDSLNFLLWGKQALFNVTMKIPKEQGNGIHRPFRVREIHAAALYQPDE